MSASRHLPLPAALADWLEQHADGLDLGTHDAAGVMPELARHGLFRLGVPETLGGAPGTDVGDAVLAIARLAYHSLAGAFVCWSQRAFAEVLLQAADSAPARRWVPQLADGLVAGSNGLSNAMKFLSGIEPLQISAAGEGAARTLEGAVAWATNLRPQGFIVAVALHTPGGGAAIAALPSDAPGLERSADLRLLGLQSTNTAALTLRGVPLRPEWLLDEDALRFLPRVRPAFVGLQCGLSIGLSRRALDEARQCGQARRTRGVLEGPIAQVSQQVEDLADRLVAGVRNGDFVQQPGALFKLRIALAETASQAVQLELQASGGAAFMTGRQPGFARRWREAAFLPIVTPSLVQLKDALQKQAKAPG